MKNLSCMDGTSGLLELEWQCPSCTLLNKAVSFKCRVCGTPKGTSTRQAKFHSAAIEKQYVAESLTKLQTLKHINKLSTVPSCPQTNISGRRRCSSKSRGDRSEINRCPTLSNVDRSSARSYTVTVDAVTVVITEYDFLYPPSD